MVISKHHVKTTVERIVSEYREASKAHITGLESMTDFSFVKELDRQTAEYYRAFNMIRGIRDLVSGSRMTVGEYSVNEYFVDVFKQLLDETGGHSKAILALCHRNLHRIDDAPRFVPVGPATETVLLSEVA